MSTAKITVKLLGSCAEIVIGRLTQEQYLYWIEHEDELKEYGSSSSTQNKIEYKFNFLKEDGWFEFDSEVHISGPFIEECRLEINIVNDDGENKNIEYNSIYDLTNKYMEGSADDIGKDYYICDEMISFSPSLSGSTARDIYTDSSAKDTTIINADNEKKQISEGYYFWACAYEKGGSYAEFELPDGEFDERRLVFKTINYNEEAILENFGYIQKGADTNNPNDLDTQPADSTGKDFECGLIDIKLP